MKCLILNFLMILNVTAFCQKIPSTDISRVRIKKVDFTIEAEVKPVKTEVLLKKDRYYFWYTHHQINKTQGGFSGRLLNGSYQEFYLNKNLKEYGLFKNGLQTGKWKTWNEDGSLKQFINWRKGKKNGQYQNYDDNEQLTESGNYSNNQLHGEWKLYKNRELAESKKYNHGLLLAPKSTSLFWKRLNVFKKETSKDTVEKRIE